jgi:hypothetical protein
VVFEGTNRHFGGDAFDDFHMANSVRKYKTQFAAFCLLVQHHATQDGVGLLTQGEWDFSRQMQGLQQSHLSTCGFGGDPSEGLCESACADHSDGDSLAMEQLPVTRESLEGMPECMSIIQDSTETGCFKFIFPDHIGFQFATAGDDVVQDFGVSGIQGVGICFEVLKKLRIEDDAIFDDFGEPRPVLAIRQGGQCVRIDQDTDGLMKGTNQIFALRMIDSGFPADGVVGTWTNRSPRA